ncbi:MAG TPA: GMC family oxidoreductase [Puia sp.]|nr:GMC family oxidoreductase [Puia sp.]
MFNKNQFAPSILNQIPGKAHYKHIVIGSGPGGAITACALAEAGRDVLLIEEGAYLDLTDLEPFSLDEMKYKYRNNGLTLTFGKPKINYVEGKCVGGGSEVNSGLYHRTPPSVLERWKKEYALQHIEEKELNPFFEQCERDVCISYNPGSLPKASLKLAEGATALNWGNQEVPRWFKYDGKTDASGNASGTKMSMTQTYIPRFLSAGGVLLTHTRCLSFSQEGKTIRLKCLLGRKEFSLTCEAIFVCAGAVHTPNLLLRSGIDKNIGKNFLLHPTIKVTALFDEAINHANMGVPVHQVKEFSPQFSFGGSISSPSYLALAMNDHPDHAGLVNREWEKMGIYYAMTNAEGKGSVSRMPFFRDPLVKYAVTQKEKENLAAGLRKLCELLLAAKAKLLFPSVLKSPAIRTMDDLSALPRVIDHHLTSLMTIHLFSSCPMGENKELCAADSFGKVHGQENVYINDASLLPTALGVNPQGTIMAFAKRNIDHFMQNNKEG